MIMAPPHKHLIAQAHNRSGKTTCFVLGMLSQVDPTLREPQALCICPTRELAKQNMEVLQKMGKFTGITAEVAVPETTRGVPIAKRASVSAKRAPVCLKLFLYLVEVEQSPPESMVKALSPLMNALIGGKLFKHSDFDVKVAVTACISEITRITAPDAPYDDEQMKEVFKLIVSTFELLVDKSSRSYSKRISILETGAKVRSCVVMLDLECDALLIDMFQHFLKAIRALKNCFLL